MSEKLKSLDLEGVWSFDVDEFIKRFESFVKYFEKEVKLINSVSLEMNNGKRILNVDTPSTNLILELWSDKNEQDSSKKVYYLELAFRSLTISRLEITEEQFKELLFLCEKIFDNARERSGEFEKARNQTFKKLLEKKW